jgi:hydroxyacylglutathione hydrolase
MKEPFLKNGIPTLKAEIEKDVEGYILIDVRQPDEYVGELGHIDGATLCTLGPSLQEYLSTADQNKPHLFICRSGVRSANATALALQMGFKKVVNMEGGMIHWNETGLKTVKE